MAKGTCSIDGCEDPAYCRSWCRSHYNRWYRQGDPVTISWTPRGETERYIREVVLAADGDECLIWPYAFGTDGYGMGHVGGIDTKVVPRIVLELTVGPPPTPAHQAAHAPLVCHTRACVLPGHLSWKTPAENAADRRLDGTELLGGSNHKAKLTEHDVRAIRADTRALAVIAADYGIATSNVSMIKARVTWAWLED